MFGKNKKNVNPMLRDSKGDKVFRFFSGLFLILLAAIVLYPVYFIIIASFSDSDAVLAGRVVLWPVDINLEGYIKIIDRTDVWLGYRNTIIYTLLTVVLSLMVTIPAGWALSRKTLPGKKFLMIYFIIPMFFGGGLIPFYNVMSNLGLINTIWAIVLPSILSVWNLFMTKIFFESSIPNGLIEAAKIDGAGHFLTFSAVVLPLAKAIMAVMALYYAVGQWNSHFNAMIFLQDESLYYGSNEYDVKKGENTFTAELKSGGMPYSCLELGGLGNFTLTFTGISLSEVVDSTSFERPQIAVIPRIFAQLEESKEED